MRSIKTVFGETLVLESLFEKMRGLMFSSRVKQPLLFVFSREATAENSIHSFFCPHFDAIFMDSDGVVVGAVEVHSTKPFICPSKPFKFLIETFPGDIAKHKVHKGLRLVVGVGSRRRLERRRGRGV